MKGLAAGGGAGRWDMVAAAHLGWPWSGREHQQLSQGNHGGRLRLAGSSARPRLPEEPGFCYPSVLQGTDRSSWQEQVAATAE